MIYDVHVHIAGAESSGNGNRLTPAFRKRLIFRLFARRFGLSMEDFDRSDLDQRIRDRLIAWLYASEVDRAVLLAFDAAYRRDGTCDEANTLMATDNDYVADIADSHRKVLFGASVHPYRRDALSELERLIERGACLVKWLPGAQNIQADDPICFPYYDLLARHRVPLLCHTGAEHTAKVFSNSLNNPRRLIPALERGVTVMAAHCGTRVMLHEKSYLREWCELTLKYGNLYGDISAFGLPIRAWALKGLLQNPALAARLVYGSDFPVPTFPCSFLGHLSPDLIIKAGQIQNPFSRAVQLMKAAGVPSEVFSRAGALLRIPEEDMID